MEPYCKMFVVNDHQVVAMMRGAGETDGHSKLELSTEIDGIFVGMGLDVPTDKVQDKFDGFDEQSALTLLGTVFSMLGGEESESHTNRSKA